jgi:hypothetical protein
MLEFGLQHLISNASAFTTLAGTRLFPVLLREAETLPAATYQLITTRPLYTLNKRINFTQSRIQFDTWAGDYVSAKNLMAAINAAVDNFSGDLVDGTHVFGVQLLTSGDLFESDANIYRCTADYMIQHSSPVS